MPEAAAALCLLWAASTADLPASLPPQAEHGEHCLAAQHIALIWTHSIERVRWEEHYQLHTPAAPAGRPGCASAVQPGLCPTRARVLGSGAGMEPPAEASYHAHGWEWAPAAVLQPALVLAHSGYTADYTLCIDDRCAPLAQWLPRHHAHDAGVVQLRVVAQPHPP
jgi:hypothetical protein